MPVSKKTRFEVFKRDNFICQYCGRVPPDIVLECDHVFPVAENGTDEIENLVTACFDCNRGKSDRLLTSVPMAFAEKMALLQEKKDQLNEYNQFLMDQRTEREYQTVLMSDYWIRKTGSDDRQYQLSDDRMSSIKMFLQRMPIAKVYEAVDIALSKKPQDTTATWKYFCGICWKMIKSN